MWVCYLDGCKVNEFATEFEADLWCVNYDGQHNPTYEYEPNDEEV